MIKKLVLGMVLMMCVMGCSKKESSAALTLTPPDWAIGTWSTTNIGGTTTWTISTDEIKMEIGGYITDYGAHVTKQEDTDTTYTITVPGDGGEGSIIFTKVDGTTIKINIGGGDLEYTKQ